MLPSLAWAHTHKLPRVGERVGGDGLVCKTLPRVGPRRADDIVYRSGAAFPLREYSRVELVLACAQRGITPDVDASAVPRGALPAPRRSPLAPRAQLRCECQPLVGKWARSLYQVH